MKHKLNKSGDLTSKKAEIAKLKESIKEQETKIKKKT